MKVCPQGYFNISLISERSATAEELYSENNSNKCISCHYTCKECAGSLDYQCTECFPDATLLLYSSSETYCYPTSVAPLILENIWYIRVFVMLIIIALLILGYFVWKFHKHRQQNAGYSHLDENVHNLEKNAKSALYSDSE